MKIKRFALVFALLALLTAAVSAAEDDGATAETPPMNLHGTVLSLEDEILLEATGLDAQALRAGLAEGSTLAELVEANEGDPDSVIAAIAAQMAEDINQRAASFLAGLDETVSEELVAVHGGRSLWGRRWIRLPRIFMVAGVMDAITQATGLDAPELRAPLSDGATFAELIEANDGDVSAVSAEIVTTITNEVNATAAERIEGLEESIAALFNTDLTEPWGLVPVTQHFYYGFWGVYSLPALEEPAA